MIFHSAFLITVFTLCMGLYEATYEVEEGIKNVFLVKYKLLQSPKRAVTEFCKQKHDAKKMFHCETLYQWRHEGVFQGDCKIPPRSFGPRYYHVVLQCKVGRFAIGSLRSEWKVFY